MLQLTRTAFPTFVTPVQTVDERIAYFAIRQARAGAGALELVAFRRHIELDFDLRYAMVAILLVRVVPAVVEPIAYPDVRQALVIRANELIFETGFTVMFIVVFRAILDTVTPVTERKGGGRKRQKEKRRRSMRVQTTVMMYVCLVTRLRSMTLNKLPSTANFARKSV